MSISLTFDVEQDLHSESYKSLKEGLPRLLKILEKYKIKATFFVPAILLEKFPTYFKKIKKQGHEIALHGYEHERFDDLLLEEKKLRIEKSVQIYKRIFKNNPKGFRAPQHSIDDQTLKILEENKFLYDSSYTPLNLLQLFFFPKKFLLWLKGFFKPRRAYILEKDFYELPISGFFIPLVSLPFRALSFNQLKIFFWLVKLFNRDIVFYAHSWDFISLPKSKIDQTFSHEKLLLNLERFIKYASQKNKFLKLEQVVKNENT